MNSFLEAVQSHIDVIEKENKEQKEMLKEIRINGYSINEMQQILNLYDENGISVKSVRDAYLRGLNHGYELGHRWGGFDVKKLIENIKAEDKE